MSQQSSLKQRIISCLILPLIGLCAASGFILRENVKLWQQAEQLDRSVKFFTAASKVIQDIQKERGMSSLFMGDKLSGAELGVQRAAVNAHLDNLIAIRADFEAELFQGVEANITALKALRADVDARNLNADVLKRFGDNVAAYVELQAHRAKSHPLNGLENELISQAVFESAKESMGRMRAALTMIISLDKPVTQGDLARVEGFRAGIVSNVLSPGLVISAQTRKDVDATLSGREWVEVLRVFDKVKANYTTGSYAEDQKAFFATITNVIGTFSGFINSETTLIAANVHKQLEQARRTFVTMLVGLLVAVALCLVLSYRLLKDLSGSLASISQNLASGANETAESARSLSLASASLASGVTEQAAALQESVAALDQIRAMVGRTGDHAQVAESLVQRSQQDTDGCAESLAALLDNIDQIQASNGDIERQTIESNGELTEIIKVIGEIADKTNVINDIVFQTRLLSFNASVEAARAGEHGKGFAVVADEVGNLARMSGDAAKEITRLLEASVSKVDRIVSDTKTKVGALVTKSTGRVQAGRHSAKRCAETLDSLQNSIKEMAVMMTQIAKASQDQSQGIDEIARAFGQLDQVTQSNSGASNEASEVAVQLSEQATTMEHFVSALVNVVQGSKDGRPARALKLVAAKGDVVGNKHATGRGREAA